MKKVLVFMMTLVMAMALSVTAFAAPGGFVSSPSGNPAPELVDYFDSEEDCEEDPAITPYSERDELDDESKEDIEEAYDDIVKADDLGDLNEDLDKLAEENNIDSEDLAVSDLFDIDDVDCDDHDHNGPYTVKLSAETLENFVGLMQYDGEKWILVKGAKVDEDGNLTFTVDELTAFAVVVNTDPASVTPPPTGYSSSWIYILMLVVSMVGLVVVAVASRTKEKA